jgi:predicted CoA-binding protein
LLERGYDVVPVYPREETILGQPVFRRVQDVPGPFGLVDVFRRSEDLPSVFADALAARAPALWLQLGCIDVDDARRAQAQGVTVVMDRCLMVDHERLLGPGPGPGLSLRDKDCPRK